MDDTPSNADNGLNQLYREVFFEKPQNGSPDNITQSGCLALALLGKDAWNAWRKNYPVGRLGLLYQGKLVNTVNFSGIDFQKEPNNDIDFEGFVFGDGACFENAKFGVFTYFRFAKFGHNTSFHQAQFVRMAEFTGARFGDSANFTSVQFGKGTNFSGAQFQANADFTGACFCDSVCFDGAQFSENAKFNDTQFCKQASFIAKHWASIGYVDLKEAKRWAKYYGLNPESFKSISFDGAVFKDKVDFTGRTFEGRTSFGCLKEPVNFAQAPLFHNCTLHQDTSFDQAKFPKATRSNEAARAYRTLKLAFAQQQAIREEQDFFKREMAEEAKSASCGRKLMFCFYWVMSDYGFSIGRPAAWLVVALLVFSLIYNRLAGFTLCFPCHANCEIKWDLIEFGLLQTLPLPGLDKWSDGLRQLLFPSDGVNGMLVALAIMLHKAFSLLALFLIGLGLRNLFKMK